MKRTLLTGATAFWLVACHSNSKSPEAASNEAVWQQASDTVAVVKEHPQTAPEQEPAVATTKSTHQVSTQHKTDKRKTESTSAASGGASAATAAAPAQNGTAASPAATEKKKGWSKTAKGAVIGGVVGAGAGAIIDKNNRGAGAVIGGVVGAGAGAIIGNQMDKKDGRH